MESAFGANGNKIRRIAAVIPILQPCRRNAVFISEFVGHVDDYYQKGTR